MTPTPAGPVLPVPLISHPTDEDEDLMDFIAGHQLGPALAHHATALARYFPGQRVTVPLQEVGDEYDSEMTVVLRVAPDETLMACDFLDAVRRLLDEWWCGTGAAWTDYIAFHLL